MLALALAALSALNVGSTSPYIFRGDPFSEVDAPFSTFQIAVDPLFAHVGSVVYAPASPGRYSVIYFIGGYNGFVPGWAYADMLQVPRARA